MYEKPEQSKIRNVAIIAHVDHGKTTLVDAFLKQTEVFRANQEEMNQKAILDSGDLEREKGITIKAKNIAVRYKGHKINIIDTPGHADFGGEVERTLNMADGCILLVDAQEGPMPQTKFVLKKALELGLNPMVVINKIDKPYANPDKVLDRVHDLMLGLATDVSQLEFPVFYAIGREGLAFNELPEDLSDPSKLTGDITPLLDGIIKHVPAPKGEEKDPFQMQITTLQFDSHTGRYLIGKINRGTITVGKSVAIIDGADLEAKKETGKISKLLVREGLDYVEAKEASAGEIVAIVGIDSKNIGATICDPSNIEALPVIKISNPSVQIKFEANTSPLVGKEGEFVTARLLQARLEKEIETNISLKITKTDGGGYFVAGRGELQLSILIEELRREGYELQIRRPEIVFEVRDGKKYEPLEELLIEVPAEYQGTVVSELSDRKAEMINIEIDDIAGVSRLSYKILTRNLIGLRSNLLTLTKGNLILNNFLIDHVPFTEQPERFRRGVIISSENGVAMDYALNTIQERGDLIVEPGTTVYQGMIIGINKFEQDLEVNPCKERQKTAVRRNQAEITQIQLKSIKPLTLDFALTFLAKDEILEITPLNLRLRKQYLTKTERDWAKRQKLNDFAKANLK